MDLLEIFKDSDDLVEFPAGTVIIEEGAEGDCVYVVMEGEVVISLFDKVLATVARVHEHHHVATLGHVPFHQVGTAGQIHATHDRQPIDIGHPDTVRQLVHQNMVTNLKGRNH